MMANLTGASGYRYVTVLLFAITMSVFVMETEAKRGCSSFGHSCFGGHGKRNAGDFAPELRALSDNTVTGQEEVAAPRPVYPPTFRDLFNAGDDIIPVRNGGFPEKNAENELNVQLHTYLKQLLAEYRKLQQQQNQQNQEGYNII